MNARKQTEWNGLTGIVAEFDGWVKGLAEQIELMHDEQDLKRLETQVRGEGQRLLVRLFERLLQQAIDDQQQAARTCPHCGGRRRHQGVRRRKLRTSLGEAVLEGIYWRCSDCGLCGHSAEAMIPQSTTVLLRELMSLLGVALASFHKAELVAKRLLGVPLDDEMIRRCCLAQGEVAARDADREPVQVAEGETLIGSCDGTMVRTRETGWREVKGFRFEHERGRFGGATLDSADRFAPRLQRAADRLDQQRAGRCVFLSDMAEWIKLAVARQLPGWQHIGDYWHAAEHVHQAGKAIYGEHEPRAKKWSTYWSRRLKRHGAAEVADRMRRTVLCYRQLARQTALLELIRFLDKHANRMDYPRYQRDGLPIGSGPMESFCKQIGRRMKGPGMFWSVANVTPMAMLVSRWSLEPERFADLDIQTKAA